MNKLSQITLLILWLMSFGCTTQKSYDVKDYGGVPDGITLNTSAIQKAIDSCSKNGGGKVILQGGTFLSGTVLLKDNVELHIAEDAQLKSSPNPNHFESIDPFIDATGQYRGQCLIGAIDVKNIRITGKGTIDGQGKEFTWENIQKNIKALGITLDVPQMPKENFEERGYVDKNVKPSYRPFLIRLVRTKGVSIQDVKLKNSAAWTLHFYQCQSFLVDNISIYNHANRNNDGIDIDSSKDGQIINTHIDSEDDALCFKTTSAIPTENISVNNCRLKSDWGAIKFGTESMGDFKNITIKNCEVYDTKGGGIKLLSVDGSNVENILIDSIKMTNVDMPLFVRLGERRLVYRNAPQQPVGSMKGIKISNLTAKARKIEESRVQPPSGIMITGTPNHSIGFIELSNINITLPGAGINSDNQTVVPENITQYPEYTLLGKSPVYGLYGRHIDKIKLENIAFHLENEDGREEMKLIDANQI
ncbi:glycoside hydrolase family 28 protein [Flammeovirga yaeyamensis]|uniref:Glycoside hydrolase family 28 protein n=1 Tax=Flammeovirga yaeyamensis TaxID=367791 RepID=A0AAX1NB43_9BACT|nr:glycoside hydrolase family 28 protein [Flammeovirga yaeyamensis]MBB3699902.1 polygalacturonase [Flammeovirga yaeyamensis]QWG04714.1 glycoside hydrolase family 28 protein [Flammeovirga yaeyamensis]